MLFATQNPPGAYGGRKILSRAFRNCFLEIHVDDMPEDELCMILERRCEVPPSYARKMVEVMKTYKGIGKVAKFLLGSMDLLLLVIYSSGKRGSKSLVNLMRIWQWTVICCSPRKQ